MTRTVHVRRISQGGVSVRSREVLGALVGVAVEADAAVELVEEALRAVGTLHQVCEPSITYPS